MVTLPPGSDLEEMMAVVGRVGGVESVQPWLRGRGWIVSSGRARPVEIVGFSDALPDQFPGAADREPGLYLSDRLAKSWGLVPGEVLELVSARPTLTPV